MEDNLLTDKDIYNYLMTSDFVEDMSPEQLKFLLHKFRGFYRIAYGKLEQSNSKIEDLDKDILRLKKDIEHQKEKLSYMNDTVNGILNKKLTIKERLFGKINS